LSAEGERPRRVLFACTLNRTRSPLAEALARLDLGARMEFESCGAAPEDEFDPFMLAVLAEAGAPLPDDPGRGFDGVHGGYDLVVALTAEARDRAAAEGYRVEYWPTPDPTGAEGSREQVLQTYRDLRDGLRARIRARFS
jgi:protein-tyrosine-phosphatase